MVLSFKEKYRSAIESHSMTIIEFKRILYNLSKNVSNAYEVIKDAIENIKKAWEVFNTRFLKAIDNVKFSIEQAMEAWHYPTSRRYRTVKVLSKCTGIEKLNLRKMMRHTWLARSYC